MSKLQGKILTLQKMSGSVSTHKSLSGNVGAKTISIGEKGDDGATFVPYVSDDGVISWTNDKDLPNPEPVNIKGASGMDGRDGADGKDGYTPVKGIDYFDGAPGKDGKDGRDGADGYTPIKGVDYFDGVNGKDGIDGSNGKDGVDGYTPVKGVDYFTDDDVQSIVNKTAAKLRVIKTSMDAIAVAGAQYYLGDQTAVSIVLPDDAEVGQMVTVSWYNGATPATLSIAGTVLAFDYTPAANTRSEINALWDGTYWAVIGNEMEVHAE